MPFEGEAATDAIKGIGRLHAPDQNELEKCSLFLVENIYITTSDSYYFSLIYRYI
jgi:hypothetical protein